MAYRIGTEQRGGGTVHLLHDDASGASAAVLPAYGFNLFDLRLPARGEARAIVDAADDWADNPRAPGGHGTPILFPFPNRIANARYTFGGKEYQLEANNGPNAIHGFAIKAPWEVVEHRVGPRGAMITGRYRISQQSPEVLDSWPTDAVLEITYTLAGSRLTLDAVVTNPTEAPLPYGFGIHPYFRLPFHAGGDLEKTAVLLPARQYWVLEDFIPTGERRPVDKRLDFRLRRKMTDLQLDDVLTDLAGHPRVCRLVDMELAAEFRLIFGDEFREIVAYTPPNRPGVIAIEPYTMTTDAINLQNRGIDAGLRVLGHGERQTLSIIMETSELAD